MVHCSFSEFITALQIKFLFTLCRHCFQNLAHYTARTDATLVTDICSNNCYEVDQKKKLFSSIQLDNLKVLIIEFEVYSILKYNSNYLKTVKIELRDKSSRSTVRTTKATRKCVRV